MASVQRTLRYALELCVCWVMGIQLNSIQFKHLFFTDKKSVSYSCTEYGKMENKS